MQKPMQRKSPDKKVAILQDLEAHPLDQRVIFIPREQIVLGTQFIKQGFIQAAIIRESNTEKELREAFNASLSSEQWELLVQHLPKLRMVFDGTSSKFDFTRAAAAKTDQYLIEEMERNLDLISEGTPTAHTAYSEILMRIPQNGVRAKYWQFHRDPFPITVHRTVYGGELEWVPGELTDEQNYMFAKDSDGFLQSVEDKVEVIDRGDTILFGTDFVHRATSKAATEGYISTSTSPAPPFF